MKLANLRWIVPAIITITLSGPAFAAASLPTQSRPAPAATSPASSPATAPVSAAAPAASDVASYAQREQQAQGLQNFRGGVGLYIGGSALVLVLLIVLILVLL